MSKRSHLLSSAFALFIAFTLLGVAAAQVSVTATTGTLGPTAYSTVKGAFDAINVGTHRGTIAISITGDTSEVFPAVLNASGSGASSYSAISIRPSGGAPRSIVGLIAEGNPMIDLNGADNVTIDGLNTDGNALTIFNSTVSAVAGTSTLRFINGATNNTVTNTTLRGASTGAVTVESGTVVFSTDALTTNGNDNNTISNNTFRPGLSAASSDTPTKGIHMLGSTATLAINNSGNIITGNNFEDYFSPARASSAILIVAGTTEVTISNNRFYQTIARTQTSFSQHSAIWIENGAGNNFIVSGNTIGFSSASGTGIYSVGIVSLGEFVPIYLRVGATVATSVQGNTIAGIAVSGGTSFIPFRAIFVNGGLTRIGNVAGNTIGSQSTSASISYASATASQPSLYAIYDAGSGDSDIRNNQIGGIAASQLSVGAIKLVAIEVVRTAQATSTVQNNLIGGVIANSIQVNNFNATPEVIGISIPSSHSNVTGNTIRNLTAGKTVTGISISTGSSNHTVSQNLIYNLLSTNATDAIAVRGISYQNSAGTSLVERNLIYGLRSQSTSASARAEVSGITVDGGTNIYRNNMINVGTDLGNSVGSASTSGSGINGISEIRGSNQFFHNSVYIGGPAQSGSGSSAAFTSDVSNNPTRSIRNNIFQNARSNSLTATGKNYAVAFRTAVGTPAGLTIDSNLYEASGIGGVFGLLDRVDVPDLAAWQDAVGQDSGSVTADPKYVNPTAFPPDLHLQTGTLTAAEGNGANLGVLDDFDGQSRALLTPNDIGADAGNFVGGDAVAPKISFAPLGIGVVAANRVLSVTLTEVSAVATGTLGPRIYFRKNVGAYSSTPCALVSGTVQNGAWNCTIDHTVLGGVALGDVVGYFVVAQDTAANLAVKPAGGFVGSNVNTISSAPSTPNQYVVGLGYSGSYNAGPGERFTSLTKTGAGGLFATLNSSALTGNVIINITGDLLIEDGAVALNQWSEVGTGNYTLLIKPSGAPRTISGSSASSLIALNDADRVTFDGSLAGGTATGIGGDAALRQLTVTNTNTGTAASVIVVARVVNGAKKNTFKNLKIVGQDSLTTRFGIFLGAGTSSPFIGTGNDNNRIENCRIERAQVGISVGGQSEAFPSTGTVILRNDLSAAGASRIRVRGIEIFSEDGAQIGENSIGGIDNNGIDGAFGIGLFGGGVINATVSRNKISGVKSSNGYSAVGIWVYGGAGVNTLSNNMITGVIGGATSISPLAGVLVDGVAGSSTRLFHNSIAMTGDRDFLAAEAPSFAVAILGVNPTVELKNNILFTTQAGNTAKSYAIGMETTTFTNLNSNYNAFYSAGLTPGYFRRGSLATGAGIDYDKIALWRADTDQDANSLAVNPLFVNPVSDLHLQAASPMLAGGTPVAGVTTDFDGQMRDSPPDIGADEIPTITPPVVTTNPLSQSVTVGSTATFTAAASGSPPPTVTWARSSDGGANYAPIPGATATTYFFTPTIADAGNLYRATFSNGFSSATSTPALLTVSYGPILNVDNSDAATKYDPTTDGVLLLRYLLGFRGPPLIANARGSGAGLRDAAAIELHLSSNLSLLDVDGDGEKLALTDGVMILRRLLNPTSLASDATASAAITAGAKRSARSDEAVVKAIDALKP